MGYDIHGNKLEPGHCEVHPWVHQEYPCSQCYADGDRLHQKDRQKKQENEQEKAYYEAMEQDHWESIAREKSRKYKFLCFLSKILTAWANAIDTEKKNIINKINP